MFDCLIGLGYHLSVRPATGLVLCTVLLTVSQPLPKGVDLPRYPTFTGICDLVLFYQLWVS